MDETIYAAAGGTGAAVRTDWTYDAWNRLIDEVNSTRGQSGFFSAHYTYDPVGNRLLKGLDADTTVGYETITDYRYGDIDGQSQLSVVSGNDRLRWEIVKVNGPEQYRVEYRYDANGFTTDKIRTGTLPGTTYYKPDLRGRLWQVSTNGDLPRAPELQYTYDSDGNLVQRQEGTDGTFTKTSDYLVDAGNPTGYAQVLEELLSNAGAATRTTYTLGSDIVSQSAKPATGSAAISHLLYDGHGSTRMLANNLASVIEQYSYDGFGNASANNPSSPSTNLLYSGELWDPTLGQQYLRARYYDPKVGRFTSFDDFQGERGDPLSLHKYLYAGADPVMNSDSNGHEFNIAGVLTTATNMARIGLGIGFGVSGAWNVAMAGMDMQRAYAATTEGSGHATQEIIGNIALFVLHAYTGLKNIQTGVWLLTGAGAPPIPPGSLGVIRAAVAGAGENPVAIGATIIAISPAVARILANAAGVYLGTNTFLSSGLPSSSTDLEDHQLLPNQFAQRFRKAGLEPEDLKIHLAKARHRLKPDGIDTGRFEESWNGQWEKFFEQKPNAGAEEILEQLATMRKDFGI